MHQLEVAQSVQVDIRPQPYRTRPPSRRALAPDHRHNMIRARPGWAVKIRDLPAWHDANQCITDLAVTLHQVADEVSRGCNPRQPQPAGSAIEALTDHLSPELWVRVVALHDRLTGQPTLQTTIAVTRMGSAPADARHDQIAPSAEPQRNEDLMLGQLALHGRVGASDQASSLGVVVAPRGTEDSPARAPLALGAIAAGELFPAGWVAADAGRCSAMTWLDLWCITQEALLGAVFLLIPCVLGKELAATAFAGQGPGPNLSPAVVTQGVMPIWLPGAELDALAAPPAVTTPSRSLCQLLRSAGPAYRWQLRLPFEPAIEPAMRHRATADRADRAPSLALSAALVAHGLAGTIDPEPDRLSTATRACGVLGHRYRMSQPSDYPGTLAWFGYRTSYRTQIE